MKSIVSLVFVVGMFFPVVTHAVTLQTINVSSVTTGGIRVGGSAVATSTSDASAEVHTTITAGGRSGTVEVKVETKEGGTRRVFTWWGGFWGKVQSVFWFF